MLIKEHVSRDIASTAYELALPDLDDTDPEHKKTVFKSRLAESSRNTFNSASN